MIFKRMPDNYGTYYCYFEIEINSLLLVKNHSFRIHHQQYDQQLYVQNEMFLDIQKSCDAHNACAIA